MRPLLCTALFLLYCTCGCFAAVVQQLPQKGKSALQTYTVSTTKEVPDPKNGEEWQPIRFAVYTKYVDVAVKYCEKKKSVEDVKEMEDEVEDEELIKSWIDILCSDPNTKMTEEKKDTLLNKILPEAIKLHTDRLKVKLVKDKNLIIKENKLDKVPPRCGFMIPSRHRKEGIPNADFVIYVVLSRKYKEVAICSQDDQKRPTSAIISFIPNEINATRHFIRFAAREIAKGLGFKYKLMKDLGIIKGNNIATTPKGADSKKKKDHTVKPPKAVEIVLEEHYGCNRDSKVKGSYLENEGENEKSPYWKRRIAKDELMSTYIGEPTGMYYTNLTLGVFHDMPYYSAVFEKAEPMSWGNKSGCDFLQGGKKDEMLKEYPHMFCKEDEKKILQCTSDRFALGMCSTKNKPNDKLPDGYQYFAKEDGKPVTDSMDGYPIIKPLKHTACEDGDETLMPGSLLGSESRCLKGEDLKLTDSSDSSITIAGVCAKVKCDNDNNKVRVQLKGYSTDVWHECKEDGEQIKLDGSVFSSGTVVCPNFTEVCTGLPKTELPTIMFDNGTEDNDLYDNVLTVDKLKEGKGKTAENQNLAQTAVNSPALDTQDETDGTSPVNNTAVVSDGHSGSNGQQSGEENTRESESTDATSPSTSNPSVTEGRIKEESKSTKITVVLGSDSSIMVSYMAPLAFLVCVIGFVMVP